MACGYDLEICTQERIDQIATVQWTDTLVKIGERTFLLKLRPRGAVATIPCKYRNWMLRAFPSGHVTRTSVLTGAAIGRRMLARFRINRLERRSVVERRLAQLRS